MSETNETPHYLPPPSGPGLKIPILFGVVIALVVANVYLFLQLDQVRTEMASMRESMLDEVSNLRETSTVTSQTQQRRLETMRDELEAARRQAAVAAGQAKTEATARAEELAKELEAEQERVRQAQEQTAQQLNQVAASTNQNTSTIGDVQSQVTEAKSAIDKTISDLRQVTGDLGVQSGLIATNADELKALKALGDRDYFEFDIRTDDKQVRVGDIMVQLRSTNKERGRFTLDVIADDRRVEKRQRSLNEPLQFYTSSSRQPYELVVNTVERNHITGYLAVPKVKVPRRSDAGAAPDNS